ncbi:MAG: hypothetical protein J0I09_02560 [Sphingobacteriia bacterium]|nr:hypothetical protein [Sphingobacteriia bacterium]
MKNKLIAILCFNLFLFSYTDAYQFLKLPALVQHYIQHKKSSPGISLLSFLKLHYQKKLVVDDDFQQDMQLPFKTTTDGAGFSSLSIVHLTSCKTCLDHIQIKYVATKKVLNNTNLIPSIFSEDIFQPPRYS